MSNTAKELLPFHKNSKGEVVPCPARIQCRLSSAEDHIYASSIEEARKIDEKILESQADSPIPINKKQSSSEVTIDKNEELRRQDEAADYVLALRESGSLNEIMPITDEKITEAKKVVEELSPVIAKLRDVIEAKKEILDPQKEAHRDAVKAFMNGERDDEEEIFAQGLAVQREAIELDTMRRTADEAEQLLTNAILVKFIGDRGHDVPIIKERSEYMVDGNYIERKVLKEEVIETKFPEDLTEEDYDKLTVTSDMLSYLRLDKEYSTIARTPFQEQLGLKAPYHNYANGAKQLDVAYMYDMMKPEEIVGKEPQELGGTGVKGKIAYENSKYPGLVATPDLIAVESTTNGEKLYGVPTKVIETIATRNSKDWADVKTFDDVPDKEKKKVLFNAIIAGVDEGEVRVKVNHGETQTFAFDFKKSPELKKLAEGYAESAKFQLERIKKFHNLQAVTPKAMADVGKLYVIPKTSTGAVSEANMKRWETNMKPYAEDIATIQRRSANEVMEEIKILQRDTASPAEFQAKLYEKITDRSITAKEPYIFIDIETSGHPQGMGEYGNDIIDVGYAVVDLQTKEQKEAYTNRFGVTGSANKIGTGFESVHKINVEDIRGKKPFGSNREAQQKLLKKFKEAPLVAQYAAYEDTHFTVNLPGYMGARRRGEIKLMDSKRFAQMLTRSNKSYDPRSPEAVKSYSLEKWAWREGTLNPNETERHLGLEDSLLTADTLASSLFSGKTSFNE